MCLLYIELVHLVLLSHEENSNRSERNNFCIALLGFAEYPRETTSKNSAEVISDGNYYLDRNPLIFHHILDFYSEGRFHLPRNICPIQARREVEFWGIPLTEVPPCCYETLYGDNESELKAISALEEEINEVEEKYNQMKRQHDTPGSFSWIAIRYKLVHALNFPMQTLLGRVSLHVT